MRSFSLSFDFAHGIYTMLAQNTEHRVFYVTNVNLIKMMLW